MEHGYGEGGEIAPPCFYDESLAPSILDFQRAARLIAKMRELERLKNEWQPQTSSSAHDDIDGDGNDGNEDANTTTSLALTSNSSGNSQMSQMIRDVKSILQSTFITRCVTYFQRSPFYTGIIRASVQSSSAIQLHIHIPAASSCSVVHIYVLDVGKQHRYSRGDDGCSPLEGCVAGLFFLTCEGVIYPAVPLESAIGSAVLRSMVHLSECTGDDGDGKGFSAYAFPPVASSSTAVLRLKTHGGFVERCLSHFKGRQMI